MPKKSFFILSKKHHFIAMFLVLTGVAYSQDLEPRVYANVAKNLNVIAVGYVFMDGNVLTDSSLPIKDFTIQSRFR
jgi:hypothetical protein